MPAAAVIPAPLVYTTSTAVKKLVVGSAATGPGPPDGCVLGPVPYCQYLLVCSSLGVLAVWRVYLEKIGVLRTGVCLNSCAWNNGIESRSYFVRRSPYRRRIIQVSALSTFDGSLCDYHGCNG